MKFESWPSKPFIKPIPTSKIGEDLLKEFGVLIF